MLSVMIINYNIYDVVLKCVDSVKQNNIKNPYEIIIVDNNSVDRSIDNIVNYYEDVIYILSERNEGFGSAINLAIRKANGKYILFTNPDIIFTEEAFKIW